MSDRGKSVGIIQRSFTSNERSGKRTRLLPNARGCVAAIAAGSLLFSGQAMAADICEQSFVFASDGEPHDYFASGIRIDDRFAIVGAVTADAIDDDTGAIYIFELDGTWGEVQAIQPQELQQDEWFGASVGISGDWAVVGAPGYNPTGNGPDNNTGRAWFFLREDMQQIGFQWDDHSTVTASDGSGGDHFGGSEYLHSAVDIDGTLAIIGAPMAEVDSEGAAGKAYIFRYDSTGDEWEEEAILEAPTPNQSAGFRFDQRRPRRHWCAGSACRRNLPCGYCLRVQESCDNGWQRNLEP